MAIEGAAQTERIAYLDGWRGLAIISVLIGHFFGAFPMGSYGVELFFVLSGRLMADILYVKRMPLPKFFQRRFSRIYPALLFLVLALGMMTIVGRKLGVINEGASLASAISALTFTANYAEILGWTDGGLLGHIWSVAIEEHCYAMLALLALILVRDQKRALIVCITLAVLAMANGMRLFFDGAGDVHEIYWRTDVRLAPVFLSAGLYLLVRRMPAPSAWVPVVCALASLPIYLVVEPLPLKFIVPTALLAYAINTIDYAPRFVLKGLSGRLITATGMVSYSLYLWQQPFYVVTKGYPQALVHSLAVIPAIIAAILSYNFIEKPARRWINERWGKRRPAAAPAAEGSASADQPAYVEARP